MDDPRNSNASPPDTPPAPDWLALDREDVAAVAAAYRRESRSPRQWAWYWAGLGGLALGPTLIAIGARLGWPEVPAPVFFFSGWAVFLGAGLVVWRRERRLRAALQLRCLECDAPLLDGKVRRDGATAADLVVVTGHCPRCGGRILPP